MPPRPGTALTELLGHAFADPTLLEDALTQGGALGGSAAQRRRALRNQRLEFLGDRVLGLCVARLLLERYPTASEGALTSRSQVLVSTVVLAELAAAIDLDRHLAAPAGSGAHLAEPSPKMRADALEAMIGALFLDGGLEPTSAFIERLWRARVEAMAEAPRDPKMALQEWALERALPLPSYSLLGTDGPAHAPSFEVEVRVEGWPAAAGSGTSKRRAEQAAATRLLETIAHHGRPRDQRHG